MHLAVYRWHPIGVENALLAVCAESTDEIFRGRNLQDRSAEAEMLGRGDVIPQYSLSSYTYGDI